MTDLRELIARAAYDRQNKGLNNCWAWDDSGLDDEHPGARDRLYREADAIIAALDNAGLVVVAKPQERKGCSKCGKPFAKGCSKCGKPFAWNHEFVWIDIDNYTRMHRDCDNPTVAKRWEK